MIYMAMYHKYNPSLNKAIVLKYVELFLKGISTQRYQSEV